MNPLLIFSFILFASCTKNLLREKPVSIEAFKSVIAGRHFKVSAYYNNDGPLPYPENTLDDVFSFEELGEINSKEPCRITYVPFTIYQEGTAVKMDWVNLSVSYETFEVRDVSEDGFTLVGLTHSIRYATVKTPIENGY